jgi:hypothetical protein
MHGPINVKYPNNNNKWQMEFNSAFKGLKRRVTGTNRDTISYRKLLVPKRPVSCPNREVVYLVNSVNSALIMQIVPNLCDLNLTFMNPCIVIQL